jgi:hypothetical protein
LPFVGSLSSKYGGKAGLSVATVSVPGVRVLRLAFVHLFCAAAFDDVPEEDADDELEPELELPPQAARASAAAVARAGSSGRAGRVGEP